MVTQVGWTQYFIVLVFEDDFCDLQMDGYYYLNGSNASVVDQSDSHMTGHSPLLMFCTPYVLSLVPPIVYWVAVAFYATAAWLARLVNGGHESEEPLKQVQSRSREPSFANLMFFVVLEQIMMVIGTCLFSGSERPEEYFSPYLFNTADLHRQAWAWFSLLSRLALAVIIVDAYSYWLHRLMHTNKFCYKHFHSWHHRYNITRLSAAMYNHPVEALLLDVLGGGWGQIFAGLSIGEATILYALTQWKVVQDHGSMDFAWDPMNWFSNNARFHQYHHLNEGIKTNFAQPFFVYWDFWMGTDKDAVNARKAANRGSTMDSNSDIKLHDE